ncbi:hypothetical protein [Maricaulis sp.]|uniref:hypothetical protein n=1 Tax=Maricaulis sp. TaxID=1486257 RepID=UPI00260E316A|nr:hypothetical protein [Maricaulis sp.]
MRGALLPGADLRQGARLRLFQEPCRNLAHHSCTIHESLTEKGFPGCVAYDCLGAGNRVVQEVFDGRSWQDDPRLTRPMMEAFAAMREVHKRLDLLRAAQTLPLSPEHEDLRQDYLARLETGPWDGAALNEFDAGLALEIDILLHRVAEYVRLDPEDGWFGR